MASVAPRTKMISLASAALRNDCIFLRAPSNSSVACSENPCELSPHRTRRRRRARPLGEILWAISWRQWSSDFLPVFSGVLAAVLCRRTRRRVGHLAQAVVDQPLHVLPDGSLLHAVEALAGEGEEQELARGHLVDSARAQVEQGVPLNLADGGPVGAFHVVGVDLQLRLGVDLRVIGKQQVAGGLLG